MSNKIAILGHQQITKYVTEFLLKNNIVIDCIIGLKKKSEEEITDYFDIQSFCSENKIDYYHPDKYSLKSAKDIDFFSKGNFDLLLVVGWSRLVPEEILSIINKSSIGWHGGMFKPPRCRGRAVVNWALIEGKKKFYVYTMSLKPGIDCGDIYLMEHTYFNIFDDSQSAYFKMSVVVSDMYLNIINNYNKLTPVPQSKSKPTYLPKRSPENSGVSWLKPTIEIYNFIRALNDPFPNAFTCYENNFVYIKKAIPFMQKNELKNISPGKVYHVFNNNIFTVGCLDGLLLVQEFESSSDFYPKCNLSFKLESGSQLDCPTY